VVVPQSSSPPSRPRGRPLPVVTAAATKSSRPLMVLLDLLGRRWVLRVLWELRDGELTFVALRRAAGGLSQSVLTLRLRELKQAGLVESVPDGGYRLTPDGRSLVQEMSRLDRWAQRWADHEPSRD
jgi:DNA-binding HxlR family transcriptional regulator